jgi:hypothetical protein
MVAGIVPPRVEPGSQATNLAIFLLYSYSEAPRAVLPVIEAREIPKVEEGRWEATPSM